MASGRVGYLGPQGTFSEEAALLYQRKVECSLYEYPTIGAVIEAVTSGEVDQGLVPLENRLEGGVGATLDCLSNSEGILISNEIYYPIRQCLMAEEDIRLDQITVVLSHPHALGQCSKFINNNLPKAEPLPVESTAAAAKNLAGNAGYAAIAPRRAAELFNLTLLKEGIEDNRENATRFVVLSSVDQRPTGDDKTSLVLTILDRPGSLYRVLGCFARRGINLTRIESRPSREIIGDWLFFIDCEGHCDEFNKTGLWQEISSEVTFLKLLGSYPKGEAAAVVK